MLFTYSALNKAGKVQNGTIEADAETSARSEIKGKGLFLVSLKTRESKTEREEHSFPSASNRSFRFSWRASWHHFLRAVCRFFRHSPS